MLHTALLAACLALGADPAAGASQEEIGAAIEKLGDDQYAAREAASKFLWSAGKAAQPALERAARSPDREIAFRAAEILEKFQFGIYPDTPPEIVALVHQYRGGDNNVKLAVLSKIKELGAVSTLFALIDSEPNQTFRQELTKRYLISTESAIRQLLVEGDIPRAENFLELAAARGYGQNHLAAYLLLTNRIERRIEQLQTTEDASGCKLLAYLQRAQGNMPAARGAAEKSADALLQRGVLMELGDWPALAQLQAELRSAMTGNLESLGYAAAFHRLAGNNQEAAAAIEAIKKIGQEQPEPRPAFKALAINDQLADGIKLLNQRQDLMGFHLLCQQLRFREALATIDLADPRAADMKWFNNFAFAAKNDEQQLEQRLYRALAAARALYRVGEKEAALNLLSLCDRSIALQDKIHLVWLAKTEFDLGMEEQALGHAGIALTLPEAKTAFQNLFGVQAETADAWWDFFRRQRPDELPQETLRKVRQLLLPAKAKDLSAAQWTEIAEQVEQMVGTYDKFGRARWFQALGDVSQIRGDLPRARAAYQQAADATGSPQTILALADLFAQDESWADAAEWYHRAREKDSSQCLAIYLEGRALMKAGSSEEGQKLMDLARLLPLGDGRLRHALAEGLQARGMTDEARHEWELVLRVGAIGDWSIYRAAREVGTALADRNPLVGAELWRRLWLSGLAPSTFFLETESYVQLPAMIHKTRARGLLASGSADEADREIELALAALPGDISLALEVVPALEKAGRQQQADELFGRVYAINEQACVDFPHSALDHNNLAWLAAKCRRRLDDALAHAQLAVQLAPDNAGNVDTLAEVYFQRGDRPQAIAHAQKCISMDPNNRYFREQLARFEQP